jgi:hypothetical protein
MAEVRGQTDYRLQTTGFRPPDSPGKRTAARRVGCAHQSSSSADFADLPSPAFGRNQRRVERRFSFDRSYCVWQEHARRNPAVVWDPSGTVDSR